MTERGKGRLFVVSTPIGNLKDFTFRGVETLEEVDCIAAEDTRRTRILLNHYNLKTPLSSYNSYNKIPKGREFVRRMENGENIALVSDAGTPGVSDPLYHLVKGALEAGIVVESIPGASALLSGLVVSGLPTDRFLFEGFLPRKKGRSTRLKWLATQPCSIVFFESPHRIGKTLGDILETFGNRQAAIAREMTKLHEEINRGTLEELIETHEGRKWKGEITLIVAGADSKKGE